jgi:ubiquinone/menaquinone biosynthesis C-methylase UbiE
MILSRRVFDEFADEYDRWFDEHREIYDAEVRMLQDAVPRTGRGLEIGVGSGRFAAPLGIRFGIDPSRNLLRIAKNRGIEVVAGVGEHLPYRGVSFDYVLMNTVICFLDDAPAVFCEINCVLKAGGILTVGFIEKNGEVDREYSREPGKGTFLRFAKFLAVEDVVRFFQDAGFADVSVTGTSHGFCVMNGKKW